ncbi:MAG: hypothetical protein HS132_12940 [Planctomycetia bacterium]|nr:hypothetical protein [Planctomycetia bacterium]
MLVFIGRHGNGGSNTGFNGVVDDVRVYKRALSAQEIKGLYDTFMVLSNNGVNIMHGHRKAKTKSVNMR